MEAGESEIRFEIPAIAEARLGLAQSRRVRQPKRDLRI